MSRTKRASKRIPHRRCVVCYGSYVVGTYASHKNEPEHQGWLIEVTQRSLRHRRAEERMRDLRARQVTIVDMYLQDATYTDIAKRHDISRQRVYQIVSAAGVVQPRKRGPRAHGETCFIDGMEVYDWIEHRLSSEHKAALAQVVAASSKLVGEMKNG